MAKATTKKTAAKKTAAATPKPGSTPARTAADKAASQAQASYDAKADTLKAQGDKSKAAKVTRYVVADGKSVRSRGVRFMAGEAIDLTERDAERLKEKGYIIADDGGKLADETGSDDSTSDDTPPLAPGDAAPPVGDAGTALPSNAGEPTVTQDGAAPAARK